MKENEKLKGLQGQIGEMHNDFEDMKRTREEARKQLEAKFQDIYKRLQTMKENIEMEAKRTNDLLRAFQSKFEYQLNELKETIYKDFNEEKIITKSKFEAHEKVMEKLEKMIIAEREERLKQTDEQLNPIRAHLASLQKEQDNEKVERLQHEKEIYRHISDNVYEINEKLNREKDERNTKITLLREEKEKDLKMRDKSFGDFQNKMQNEIKIIKDEIYIEMDNRFAQQNEIVDNISNFLKTFQDTLKVVGKDA